MTWDNIQTVIFGGAASIADTLALAWSIFLPIITVMFNKMKTKLLLNNQLMQEKDVQITQLESKVDALEKAISFMGNMVATAYLTNNTISNDTKKLIGSYAEKLDKIASINLSEETLKLVDAVKDYVPNINAKKEELAIITSQVEESLNEVNTETQQAIDKLKL